MKNTTVLCILDGWGVGDENKFNAIYNANCQNYNSIINNYPTAKITTHSEMVGLCHGQMGNSEVGHTNIGAGRVVYQTLPLINKALAENTFVENENYKKFIKHAKQHNQKINIFGIASNGGVHGHIQHICDYANDLINNHNLQVNLHLFLDGRDTSPQSSIEFVKYIQNNTTAKICSMSGRYYPMDRDNNWDRNDKYIETLFGKNNSKFNCPIEYIKKNYAENIFDEHIVPATVDGFEIDTKDAIFFTNFRADRIRQISEYLCDKNSTNGNFKFNKFENCIAMASYSDEHKNYLLHLYDKMEIKNSLGEIISKSGLKQLRIAETEKYPHVTFFFNGGNEKPYNGEKRVLIPSPKVATYDLKPQMSSVEICDAFLNEIDKDYLDLVVMNFAAPDMVGHTGSIDAATIACKTIDECLGKILNKINDIKGNLILTADHGNCETMFDFENNLPHTKHTLNPVNLTVVSNTKNVKNVDDGCLGNIAPTILHLMDIEKPLEMNLASLIND